MKYLFTSILFLTTLFSCNKEDSGFLLVHAPKNGEYEVYKILGDATLQFVSNQIGELNKKLPLNSGHYLILGDCSHQMVNIQPDKTTELHAHTLSFTPPIPVQDGDLFTIQCNRYPQSHPPQQINKRFDLTVFPVVIDMLVGMKALRVDLSTPEYKTSRSIHYDLAALRVSSATKEFPVEIPPYFVSTSDGQLAITQSQEFGKWQYLLAGNYILTVNGTQREVSLKNKDALSIAPSYIKFESSPNVNIDRYQAIKGEPYTVELNSQRAFTINTIYPLISETVNFRLEGAIKADLISLEAEKLKTLTLRSVEVSLNCGPWEWECLGKKDVSLFETDSPYPFMHGSTDLPILFSNENVQIEIEGAQGLRYKIASNRDTIYETGLLLLKPKVAHKPGQMSLLVRVEGNNSNILGQSYDIPYTRETRIHLITGTYNLNHFYMIGSQTQNGGVQLSSKVMLSVKKAEVREFVFDYYLPEDKFESYSQSSLRNKRGKLRKDKTFTIF